MTNPDTNTLDGSLDQLGITMADNLVAMGVSGASASDGLTTLANKITDIAPSVGGITPVVTIDISKTPTGTITSGDTVIIECKVNADYDDESVADIDLHGYLQGATLTIKNNGTTLGTCVSDSTGIATYTISNIAIGSYSITAHFDGTGTDYESATSTALTFRVKTYIFYDDCDSAEGLSNYATSIPLRNNGVSSISYDSTNNYYVINNDTDYESFIEILPLTGVTNDFKVNAYGKVLSQSQSLAFGVYFDMNNWYHMKVEQNTKVWVSKNVNGVFNETSYNTSESTSNNIRVEWVIDDTNNEFTVNFKREDGTLVLSKTQTIPSLTSTTKYGFVSSWWRNSKVAIYEIKAEQI